ncbi:MAG: hypothetical protein Q7S22_07125 [Candidatus Micrarchaeota archaeon]|nr:hypothetical protein [Candidatus Micrarchaeota archaeon]
MASLAVVTLTTVNTPSPSRRFGRRIHLMAEPHELGVGLARPLMKKVDIYRLIADKCREAGTFDGSIIRDVLWHELNPAIKRGELSVTGSFNLCASVFGPNLNYPSRILDVFTGSSMVTLTTENMAKLLNLDISGDLRPFYLNRLSVALGILESAGELVKLPKVRSESGNYHPWVLAVNRDHPDVFARLLENLTFKVFMKLSEFERTFGRPCTLTNLVMPKESRIFKRNPSAVVNPIDASSGSVRKCLNRHAREGGLLIVNAPGSGTTRYSAVPITSEINLCLRERRLTETMRSIILGTEPPKVQKTVFEDTHLRLIREILARDMSEQGISNRQIAQNLGIASSNAVKKMLKKPHLFSVVMARETLIAHAEYAKTTNSYFTERIQHYIDLFYPAN